MRRAGPDARPALRTNLPDAPHNKNLTPSADLLNSSGERGTMSKITAPNCIYTGGRTEYQRLRRQRPASVLYEKFGIVAKAVVATAHKLLDY